MSDVSMNFPVVGLPATITLPEVSAIGTPRAKEIELQWLRGFAALFVLFYHAAIYQSLIFQDNTMITTFGLMFGRYGVAAFFALSGYLMSGLVRRQNAGRFMLHRVVRIYPMYFIIVALAISIAHLDSRVIPVDLTSLSLIPTGRSDVAPLGIEWTLTFEITYYSLLCLIALLGLTRWIDLFALIWIGAMLVAVLLVPEEPDRMIYPPIIMLFISTNLPFAVGLLIPRLLRAAIHPLLLLGAAAFFLFVALKNYDVVRWSTGLSAALLIASAASLGTFNTSYRRGIVSRSFEKLGDFSYALYLVHVSLILLIYPKLKGYPSWDLWILVAVLAIAAAIPLGILDIRLYARLRALVDRQSESKIRFATYAYLALFAAVAGSAQLWSGGKELPEPDTKWLLDMVVKGPAAGQEGRIIGAVDAVKWLDPTHLRIVGWVGDRSDVDATVRVALLTRTQVAAIVTPALVRKDVGEALDVPTWSTRPVGFAATIETPCAAQEEHFVAAFTTKRHFALLKLMNGWPPCP